MTGENLNIFFLKLKMFVKINMIKYVFHPYTFMRKWN